LGDTEFPTNNRNAILVEPFLEGEELLVHVVVIVCGKGNQEYDSNED
jgi:hypothetical protein